MKKAFFGILSGALLAGLMITGCDNTPGPGTAEVKVTDHNGQPQKRVKVVLYCTETGCVVKREGKTNELGVYTQQFELPVVLRARSVRYDTTVTYEGLPPNQIKKVKVDSVCGEGFIQVENDEIATESITILSCN